VTAVRVKVCGLTSRDDALYAVEYGADALGFVFAPHSRRRADPEVVAGIVAELPPEVTAIGVFQDQPVATVRECMLGCGLHVAQLHGDEDLAYLRALAAPLLKAVGVATRVDLARLDDFPGLTTFLLDAVVASSPAGRSPPGSYGRPAGGTGRTFDWCLAAAARERARIVLAGGLTPENVAEGVRVARPWGVDAATGTERGPGRKDLRSLRRFIREAHRAAVEAGLEVGPDPAGVGWGDGLAVDSIATGLAESRSAAVGGCGR
jgi:phosphoribosylanthranilate isomerase